MTRIPLAAGVAAALAVTLSACGGPAAAPSAGTTLTSISNGDMVTRVISNPLGIGFDVLNGDLTSDDAAGHQLADIPAAASMTLTAWNAATGKQLSYGNDTWTDSGGSPSCPTLLESGLSGVGWNTQQVSQLMAP